MPRDEYVEMRACRTCGEEWAATALDCTGECDDCATAVCMTCDTTMSRSNFLDHDCGVE